MLHVHSSNHLESLLAQLLTQINTGDPFDAEVIVVQNPGMSRWLSQQIAEREGISANFTFSTPGVFLWQAAQCWLPELPDSPPRNEMRLQWQIFNLLPEFLSQSVFKELEHYLSDDQDSLKRFQLAGKIAATFEQYLSYRADLIEEWQQGKEVHWQAVLWRALASNDESQSWGDIRKQLFSMTGTKPTNKLPARVSIFGISSLPPLYLDLMQWFAQHTEITLYYLNPCSEYWADIQGEKSQARRRAKAYRLLGSQTDNADPVGLLDIGNPMLASWGHAGQGFLDLLLEREVEESESFVQPVSESLLHSLQSDILELSDKSDGSGAAIAATDHSVVVHSCHSALREVQVLHDQLLHLFEILPKLEPRDVIVMSPDIDRYAPFIDAVFGSVSSKQRIPWSVSDRRLRSEQQLLEAFLSLLQLPESRFESTDIIELLQVPAIRRRFKLELSDLNRLRQWISESGIRWSLDADMRAELGLPALGTNSWQFGLKRMFVGYALPSETDLYEGVAPYSEVEGTDSDRLGILQHIIDLCRQWRRRLKAEHLVTDWLTEIDQIIEAFFDPDHSERHALQSMREGLLASLTEANMAAESTQTDTPVNINVLLEVVNTVLEDTSNVRQFLTGRVSFSNMVPMRSIPFRVVCLLGMNADDFPRDHRPMSFDLMAMHPRRGDRLSGNNDRYLFLETLLSARDVLYISYTGRDSRDNSPKAASTVVTETLAYINSSCQRAGESSSEALTVLQHPLQPFSVRYFDHSNERLFNYKAHWFDAAKATPANEEPPFVSGNSALAEPSKVVYLHDLIAYYTDPSKHFLVNRLDVRLPYGEDELKSIEPFDLTGLDKWQFNQQALQLFKNQPKEDVKQTLYAQGITPDGINGELLFNATLDKAITLDARVLKHESALVQPLEVALEIDSFLLQGHLTGLQQNGLFRWRFGALRSKYIIALWIEHLCLCALQNPGVKKQSAYVFEGETLLFKTVENPLQLLQVLLQARHQGLVAPQPYFPESSYAYANSDDPDKRYWKAYKIWAGDSRFQRKECEEYGNTIVWRGVSNPLNEDFERLSLAVFSPLIENRELIAATDDYVEEEGEE